MIGRETWKVVDEFLKEAVAGNIERLPKYKNTEVHSPQGAKLIMGFRDDDESVRECLLRILANRDFDEDEVKLVKDKNGNVVSLGRQKHHWICRSN